MASTEPRRDWRPIVRAALIGALLAALALFAVELLLTLVERGTGLFSRLPESLKVTARRGLLDQRVAGGDAYEPRLLPWLAGMVALVAAGRTVARGEDRLGPRLLLGASVALPYGLLWALAALASFRTILEEEPLTLLWPFAWGVLFGGLGGLTAASALGGGERRVRIAIAGARTGLAVLAGAGLVALAVHGVADARDTARFFDTRGGYVEGITRFVARLPTALANVERVGTLETVEHLAPLAEPSGGAGLTSWPRDRRGTYGFFEPRPPAGRDDTAPVVWWLLLLVPLAVGGSTGRAVGALNGRAVEGAAAGAISALGLVLVVFAGSPAPGAFGQTPEGPALLAPLLLSLLWFVPVAAIVAELTWRRRPAAVYAPVGAVGEPIGPGPNVDGPPPAPPTAPPDRP